MMKKDEVKGLEVENNTPEAEKKSFNEFGKQEKHTIEDVEYTFQLPGTCATQTTLNSSKGPLNTSSSVAYRSRLTDSVIVAPKLNRGYWDEHKGYREVMALADSFLGRVLN